MQCIIQYLDLYILQSLLLVETHLNFSTTLTKSDCVMLQASWKALQMEVFSRYCRVSLHALKNCPGLAASLL